MPCSVHNGGITMTVRFLLSPLNLLAEFVGATLERFHSQLTMNRVFGVSCVVNASELQLVFVRWLRHLSKKNIKYTRRIGMLSLIVGSSIFMNNEKKNHPPLHPLQKSFILRSRSLLPCSRAPRRSSRRRPSPRR